MVLSLSHTLLPPFLSCSRRSRFAPEAAFLPSASFGTLLRETLQAVKTELSLDMDVVKSSLCSSARARPRKHSRQRGDGGEGTTARLQNGTRSTTDTITIPLCKYWNIYGETCIKLVSRYQHPNVNNMPHSLVCSTRPGCLKRSTSSLQFCILESVTLTMLHFLLPHSMECYNRVVNAVP